MAKQILPKTPDNASLGVNSGDERDSYTALTANDAIVTGWREDTDESKGVRRRRKDDIKEEMVGVRGNVSASPVQPLLFSGGPIQRYVQGGWR